MANQARRLSSAALLGTLLLALAAVALVVGPTLRWVPIDFCRFHSAGRMILARQNPYGQLPFFAPPWLAFLLSPLLPFPCASAALLWILVNIGIMTTSAGIIWGLASAPGQRRWWLLVGLTALLPYTLFTYITGQLSIVVLAACGLCAWGLLTDRRWPIVAGLILVTVKPHIVALPVLVVFLELVRRRQWLLILVAAGVLVALGLVAAALIPSWPQALLTAWTSGAFYEPRENLLGLGVFGVPSWLTYPFVVYALLAWWRRPFDLGVLALAVAANLVAMPYSRSYDYVLLLLPVAAVWSVSTSSRQRLALGLVISAQLLPLVRAIAPSVGLIEVLAPALCMLGLLLVSQLRLAAPRSDT